MHSYCCFSDHQPPHKHFISSFSFVIYLTSVLYYFNDKAFVKLCTHMIQPVPLGQESLSSSGIVEKSQLSAPTQQYLQLPHFLLNLHLNQNQLHCQLEPQWLHQPLDIVTMVELMIAVVSSIDFHIQQNVLSAKEPFISYFFLVHSVLINRRPLWWTKWRWTMV